ncbi:MAG TPA: hypothetical protein VF183_15670, partial [Acidimicrobiales bacterium]
LARANGDVVACGHGDLIPALVQQLRREGVHVEGSGCAKGSIWRLVASNGRYERAEYHKHPDDLMRRTG